MRNLVTREYGRTACLDTDFPLLNTQVWNHFSEKVRSTPANEMVSYRAILGHMKFGVHELLPGHSRYVTFLRHPVRRFASYYYMLRQLGLVPKNHTFNPDLPDWNIPQHESLPRELDNGQTRALANTDLDLPFGHCTEEHLKMAQANIEKYFTFVGLTEHFDLSLSLLERLCGWRGWHFYVAKNITSSSAKNPPLSPRVCDAIAKLNRFDFELYSYASKRFWEEVARQGFSLRVKHRTFVTLNRLHVAFHHVYRPAKQFLKGKGKPELATAHEEKSDKFAGRAQRDAHVTIS